MSVIIRLQRLSWTATAADLREFFSGLHIPEGGVHIVGGRDGDAFIAFSTDEDARQAMMKDGRRVKDTKIKLLLSSRVEMQKVIEKARNEYANLQATAQPPAPRAPSPRKPSPSPERGSTPTCFEPQQPTIQIEQRELPPAPFLPPKLGASLNLNPPAASNSPTPQNSGATSGPAPYAQPPAQYQAQSQYSAPATRYEATLTAASPITTTPQHTDYAGYMGQGSKLGSGYSGYQGLPTPAPEVSSAPPAPVNSSTTVPSHIEAGQQQLQYQAAAYAAAQNQYQAASTYGGQDQNAQSYPQHGYQAQSYGTTPTGSAPAPAPGYPYEMQSPYNAGYAGYQAQTGFPPVTTAAGQPEPNAAYSAPPAAYSAGYQPAPQQTAPYQQPDPAYTPSAQQQGYSASYNSYNATTAPQSHSEPLKPPPFAHERPAPYSSPADNAYNSPAQGTMQPWSGFDRTQPPHQSDPYAPSGYPDARGDPSSGYRTNVSTSGGPSDRPLIAEASYAPARDARLLPPPNFQTRLVEQEPFVNARVGEMIRPPQTHNAALSSAPGSALPQGLTSFAPPGGGHYPPSENTGLGASPADPFQPSAPLGMSKYRPPGSFGSVSRTDGEEEAIPGEYDRGGSNMAMRRQPFSPGRSSRFDRSRGPGQGPTLGHGAAGFGPDQPHPSIPSNSGSGPVPISIGGPIDFKSATGNTPQSSAKLSSDWPDLSQPAYPPPDQQSRGFDPFSNQGPPPGDRYPPGDRFQPGQGRNDQNLLRPPPGSGSPFPDTGYSAPPDFGGRGFGRGGFDGRGRGRGSFRGSDPPFPGRGRGGYRQGHPEFEDTEPPNVPADQFRPRGRGFGPRGPRFGNEGAEFGNRGGRGGRGSWSGDDTRGRGGRFERPPRFGGPRGGRFDGPRGPRGGFRGGRGGFDIQDNNFQPRFEQPSFNPTGNDQAHGPNGPQSNFEGNIHSGPSELLPRRPKTGLLATPPVGPRFPTRPPGIDDIPPDFPPFGGPGSAPPNQHPPFARPPSQLGPPPFSSPVQDGPLFPSPGQDRSLGGQNLDNKEAFEAGPHQFPTNLAPPPELAGNDTRREMLDTNTGIDNSVPQMPLFGKAQVVVREKQHRQPPPWQTSEMGPGRSKAFGGFNRDSTVPDDSDSRRFGRDRQDRRGHDESRSGAPIPDGVRQPLFGPPIALIQNKPERKLGLMDNLSNLSQSRFGDNKEPPAPGTDASPLFGGSPTPGLLENQPKPQTLFDAATTGNQDERSPCIRLSNVPPQEVRYSWVRDFMFPISLRGQTSIKMIYEAKTNQKKNEFYIRCGSLKDASDALKQHQGKFGVHMEQISEAVFNQATDGPILTPSPGHAEPPKGTLNAIRHHLMQDVSSQDKTPSSDQKAADHRPNSQKRSLLPSPDEKLEAPVAKKPLLSTTEIRKSADKKSESPKPASDGQPPLFLVLVENLPYRFKEPDVIAEFGGSRLVANVVMGRSHGKPNGNAFLEFSSKDGLEKALKKDQNTVNGRRIAVRETNADKMFAMTGTRPQSRKRGLLSSTDSEEAVDRPSKENSVNSDVEKKADLHKSPRIEDNKAPSTPTRNEVLLRTPSTGNPPLIIADSPVQDGPVAPEREKSPEIVRDTCVLLTGLQKGTTQRDIVSFFSGFSIVPVGGVFVANDARGAAYVEFRDPDDVIKALNKSQKPINGRAVNVRSCAKQEMEDMVSQARVQSNGVAERANFNGASTVHSRQPLFPSPNRPPLAQKPLLAAPQNFMGPPPGYPPIDPRMAQQIGAPGCVIAMHNLPSTITLEEICELFGAYQIVEESVRMHYSPNGQPTGDCLLAVATPADAMKAAHALSARPMGGKKLLLYIVPC